MRILIIEDEAKSAAYLARGMSEQGFIVDIATDGEEGLYLAGNHNYDLIILDVMLPKVDGWSVLKSMRAKRIETSVLMLTAVSSVHNRVKGLELGADDYLVKPYAFSELLARARNILRRSQNRPIDVIKIADLELDLLGHKSMRDNQKIDLTPKEFALLSLMARRQGEVLSRTIIAEQVWDMNFDSDTNIVDVSVRRLRKKIDEGFSKQLIHTIRGVGYILEER